MGASTVEERLVKVETILENVNKTSNAIFDKLDKRDELCARHSEVLAIMQANLNTAMAELKEIRFIEIKNIRDVEIKNLRDIDIKEIRETDIANLKEAVSKIPALEKRIEGLESLNKWLWRTIGGAIILMVLTNFSKLISLIERL